MTPITTPVATWSPAMLAYIARHKPKDAHPDLRAALVALADAARVAAGAAKS